MSPAGLIFRIIIALFFPPLSVIGLRDVGCVTFLLLIILTIFGILPGQIAALILIVKDFNGSEKRS